MAIKELYEAVSGNTPKQHDFESANAATDFASELESVIYDMKADSKVAVNKQDTKNALALHMLSERHDAEMGDVRAQMATLTSALATLTTTLNNNEVDARNDPRPVTTNQMRSHWSSHHLTKKEQRPSTKAHLGRLECGCNTLSPLPPRKYTI